MLVRLFVFLALALVFTPAPALAQDDSDLPGPRECLDDDHTNRCLPEVQARVRALLNVAAIEDEATSGAIVYRAFYVDGYGRDMPAVSFERRPGQSPEVVIYGRDGRSTRAPVSADAWERVRREARFADRVLEPLERTTPGAGICLHSWVQTIEIANAPRERFAEEPVRRRTEDACGGGVTTRFAFFLAEAAAEQIPWCERIDPDHQRNDVTQLETCLMFSGDRMAAADLHNERLADTRWMRDEDLDIGDVRRYLGVNGPHSLTWGDQVIRSEQWSDRDVPEFLLARFTDHPYLMFWPLSVEGLDSRRVIVRGRAESIVNEARSTADYAQTWVWNESSLAWGLSDWTVGDFQIVMPGPQAENH